jgi:3-oxoacyl-[acyl-carrier protein] reductase
MDKPLSHRTALVTGGSGSIGGAIARALAGAGADIAVSYVGFKEGADTIVSEALDLGVKAVAVHLDQRDPASVETCVGEVIAGLGGLDILINNAGWNKGILFPDLDGLDVDTWDRILETNLRGPFLLARAAATALGKNGNGHIVNISSAGGIAPGSSSIAYSASKAGLNHLTRCLAVAMAPDVAVNCIAPGLVEGTRMANRLPEASAQGARRTAVLGKVGQLDDIARQVIAFCASESVTGQTIVIDGGMPTAMR